MNNTVNTKPSILLIVFLTTFSLLFRPEVLYSQYSDCHDISSFQSTNITPDSIKYEWQGNTTSWSMSLLVTINGTIAFSAPVTGNSQTVIFTNPIVAGDVIDSELDYSHPIGVICSLSEKVIVATSQIIFKVADACNAVCAVNFCKKNNPNGLPKGVEKYLFNSAALCNCNSKFGEDRITCIKALMKGSSRRVFVNCPYTITNSCSSNSPYELIVSDPGIVEPSPQDPSLPFGFKTTSELLFNVYPNPFKSNFTIDLRSQTKVKGNVIIRDIYGKTVYHQPISRDKLDINLDHLPNGVYWVSLSSNGSNVYKIIKMK